MGSTTEQIPGRVTAAGGGLTDHDRLTRAGHASAHGAPYTDEETEQTCA